MDEKIVLSIDPGRDKCGIAIVSLDGILITHSVIATKCLLEKVAELINDFTVYSVIIGNGTSSSDCRKKMSSLKSIKGIEMVDEYGTTELARKRYFKDNPPRGFRRLIPLGLQVPPEPYDDYAAIILAERYLERGNI